MWHSEKISMTNAKDVVSAAEKWHADQSTNTLASKPMCRDVASVDHGKRCRRKGVKNGLSHAHMAL